VRYELFDYQREAAVGVLTNLQRGRDDWSTYRSKSAFALSALTGSGKTVIATAVIEALLHGSSEFNVDPDARAAFLWVTDDPALNRQTKTRMLDASGLLAPNRLVVLDNDFLDTELQAGIVYFLNVQKLSKSAGLSKSGTNLRQLSMWEVLANTINNPNTDLYLVLDEAHKGMKPAQDRRTIVQRIISGGDANPPMPIVWGISATIERFVKAMELNSQNRTTYPAIQVDVEQIRAAGLIKDVIGLDQPAEKGVVADTLLRDAVRALLDFDKRWTAYSTAEGEPEVNPLLVLQVPDLATKTKLAEVVGVIEHEWPGLAPDAIAHVFGDHEKIEIAGRTMLWVPPETVETESHIRVLLAKEAVSTGWDCPRAEVLYSERPAVDVTHIAQVIGRMVRQPLAHQIATDDALNSVSCFLPLFDRAALGSIIAELEGEGTNADNKISSDVIREPKIFDRNPHLVPEVFALIESLPSISTPQKLASPLRRAHNLAKLLADDASGKAMLPDAGAVLTGLLNSKLDGLAAQHSPAVKQKVQALLTTNVLTTKLGTTGQGAEVSEHTVETHTLDVDRTARRAINVLKEGAGKSYYAYRAAKAGPDADKLQIRAEVAGLVLVDGVVAEVEAEATKFVHEQLTKHAVAIKNTTGATRDAFHRVQEQASEAEVVSVELRANEKAATRDSKSNPLPTFRGHLFSDANGDYPPQLNSTWEGSVIETEIARDNFVAWYRNPSRASTNALRIAYPASADKWTSLQPDFVVVSLRNDGTRGVSIIDPHGDYLADAVPKLRALASYAEDHGDAYVRIESIAKLADGRLRVLDLQAKKVRNAVRAHDGKVTPLYESDLARDFG
jgi:type III restriction enzyme